MKDFLKKRWQMILIALLFLFGLNKCTQSCNRQGEIDRLNIEYAKLDSISKVNIQFLNDSIRIQNEKLNILEERVSGLRNMNDAVSAERANTDEANRRASEAAKRENALRQQLKNQH